MKDETIIKISAIWAIVIIMTVDALTWKINHALWSLGIATISGLAGYQIGLTRNPNMKKKNNKE